MIGVESRRVFERRLVHVHRPIVRHHDRVLRDQAIVHDDVASVVRVRGAEQRHRTEAHNFQNARLRVRQIWLVVQVGQAGLRYVRVQFLVDFGLDARVRDEVEKPPAQRGGDGLGAGFEQVSDHCVELVAIWGEENSFSFSFEKIPFLQTNFFENVKLKKYFEEKNVFVLLFIFFREKKWFNIVIW